jgi:hypothetical protein
MFVHASVGGDWLTPKTGAEVSTLFGVRISFQMCS